MKTLTLNCKIMDMCNGASWSDEMRVTVEGVDASSEPGEVAKLVNQATYELVTGDDIKATGTLVRASGTASHGICWLDDDSGDVVIEWHLAS